jgi:gliding-associated putative ABC transporter substrate-binding component GldG
MNKRKSHIINGILPIVVVVLINVLSSLIHFGVDLTAEKRYTLTPSTAKLIASLQSPLKLTIFLEGDLPAGFKKLAVSAKDLSNSLGSLSRGKFQVEFIRPGEGMNEEEKAVFFDSLQRMGINPTNVKAQLKKGEERKETLVFPGAILSSANGQIGIDFLEGQSQENGLESLNNAEALLEYKVAKAIVMLNRDEQPRVAYLTGNGEPLDLQVYDLIEKVLRREYQFNILPIDSVSIIPQAFDAIVIVKPRLEFSAVQKLKLDQYIMNGGKVLWALDNLFASLDSLQNSKGSFVAFDLGLNLDDLLFKYGARLNRDLVQDLECDKIPSVVGSVGDKPQIEVLPWPYAPLLRNTSGHPISKNLDYVLSAFPQSVDTVEAPGIVKSIILATSNYARSLQTPAVVEWNSIQREEDLKQFSKSAIPTGLLLEGQFRSLYTNRIGTADLAMLQENGQPFKSQADQKGAMIVLADGDILLNPVSQNEGPLPMGSNAYTRQQYGNRDLAANLLFYLTGGESTMLARAKTYQLRLLDLGKIESDKLKWQLINLIFPISLLFFLFFINQVIRKKRYSL